MRRELYTASGTGITNTFKAGEERDPRGADMRSFRKVRPMARAALTMTDLNTGSHAQ